MKKKIICSILSFVMVIGLILPYLSLNASTVAASASDEISSWKFSETVTEENDSAVWKAVFMDGSSTEPTGGRAYEADLRWHDDYGYYYSTQYYSSYGVVRKQGLETGSNARAPNKRPAMEFTAPKTGTVKISLEHLGKSMDQYEYNGWGCPGCRYDGEYLRNYYKKVHEHGGVMTLDVCVYRDGRIDKKQMEAMKQIKSNVIS